MWGVGRGSGSGDGILKNGLGRLILSASVTRRNGEDAADVSMP